MSEPGKAVFLSYASQDAAAATRIADALRAAGVEVWFDQSELVGGDAWDAKIRKQIKDCALLIPIISANTQSRTEGYFRLEWRLADQRTHLMAKGRPFLLPVVIDGTRDADAHVPDSFTEVQWTRLPGGEGGMAFAARVKKLLGGSEVEPGLPRPGIATRGEVTLPPSRSRLGTWLALGGLAVVVLGLSIARPWQHSGPPPVTSAEKPAAPLSEARKLANQAMQILEDPNFTRETSWLADELCQRALALEAGDAEIWTVAAMASINLYWNTYDTSAARREKISSQAARAAQLDPKSVRAALVVARSLDLGYDNAESLRVLRELHQRAPEDQQVIFHLIWAEGQQGNDTAVQGLLQKLRALPRTGLLPLTLWFVELRLRGEGRFAEAGAILDEMLSEPGQLRGAYYEKLHLLMESWHDLAEVEPFLGRIPTRYLQEPAFGSLIAQFWLWRNQPEKALQALARVPQDYFEEYAAREPKGYLTGWAHTLAGRPAAAQAEWRNALALVEERMKSDNRNFTLLNQRALLLGLTGQREAAREAWRLRVELGGEQNRPDLNAEAMVLLAVGEPEPAVSAIERGWTRRKIGPRAWTLPVLRYHPAYAAVRDDARLQRIITEGVEELRQLREKQLGTLKPGGAIAALADEKSVAVLAFANLSDDKANEYFSDGISEELLNVLAKVPGLKVSARTSAFFFKGKEVPIPEIAKQLGVAYVVEGSVRKAGGKVRITAQLIKAADGFHVWSDTFTRDLKDIFAVQDEIAGLIARNLQLKMGMGTTRPTVDLEAYQEYLAGRAAAAKAGNTDLQEAVRHFTKSVAIEPTFTAAWVQLASAHTQLGRWGGAPTLQSWAAARAAIDRALTLEPDSPDVLLALGWIRRTAEWDWRGAEQAFRRSLQLRPNHPDSLAGAAVLLFNIGQTEEAFRLGQQAARLDPLNAATQIDLSIMFYLNHNWREAEQSARRALQLAPGGGSYHSILGWSLTAQGRYDEAEAEIARDNNESEQAQAFGSLAIARGQEPVARKWLVRLEEIAKTHGDNSDVQMNIAWLSVGLGDKDRAFAALERARASRDPSLSWVRNSWYLESLHTDPRWPVFLRKVGLADDQVK